MHALTAPLRYIFFLYLCCSCSAPINGSEGKYTHHETSNAFESIVTCSYYIAFLPRSAYSLYFLVPVVLGLVLPSGVASPVARAKLLGTAWCIPFSTGKPGCRPQKPGTQPSEPRNPSKSLKPPKLRNRGELSEPRFTVARPRLPGTFGTPETCRSPSRPGTGSRNPVFPGTSPAPPEHTEINIVQRSHSILLLGKNKTSRHAQDSALKGSAWRNVQCCFISEAPSRKGEAKHGALKMLQVKVVDVAKCSIVVYCSYIFSQTSKSLVWVCVSQNPFTDICKILEANLIPWRLATGSQLRRVEACQSQELPSNWRSYVRHPLVLAQNSAKSCRKITQKQYSVCLWIFIPTLANPSSLIPFPLTSTTFPHFFNLCYPSASGLSFSNPLSLAVAKSWKFPVMSGKF